MMENTEEFYASSMAPPDLLNKPQGRRSNPPHVNWSIRGNTQVGHSNLIANCSTFLLPSQSPPQTPVKSHKASRTLQAGPSWSRPSSKYDLGNSDWDEEDSHSEESKSDNGGNKLGFRSADADSDSASASGADQKDPEFRRRDYNDMIVDNVPGKTQGTPIQSSQLPAGRIHNREGQGQNCAKKKVNWKIHGNPESRNLVM